MLIRMLLRATVAALGFWLASRVVPGVFVSTLESLGTACLVLGAANAMVRPLVLSLGLPANFATIGLTLLVANAVTLTLTDWELSGLQIAGPMPVLIAAVVISVGVWVSGYFIDPVHEIPT